VRRGDEHAGAIYICLNRLDGTVTLYGPARGQSATRKDDG
jgi:hypothetical protein